MPSPSTASKVDVFFLFSDTGKVASKLVPNMIAAFGGVVEALKVELPKVDFGFGVGRFEDYGGAWEFGSSTKSSGRPFRLIQPIISVTDAGDLALKSLVEKAMGDVVEATKGDTPESGIEALFQVATGRGFDGDGDGFTTGTGDSGDVPAFDTLPAEVLSSGKVGGAGFREDALKLVLLATDFSPVAAYLENAIPLDIIGTSSCKESSEEFDGGRFGFVSDKFDSTLSDKYDSTLKKLYDVVPKGAATVPETVKALNDAGIRVIGFSPKDSAAEKHLRALARLTGAVVKDGGSELVYPIDMTSITETEIKDAVITAINAAVKKPIDVSLVADLESLKQMHVTFPSPAVRDVAPGEHATLKVTFTGEANQFREYITLKFVDAKTKLELASLNASIECDSCAVSCPPVTGDECESQGNKFTICHSELQESICVTANAWPAHCIHHAGDYCGACEGP
jgi:hypothetical protein